MYSRYMPIDPRRLAVLRAVAQAGGVLAAAPVLNLTPSAVSKHIARLEAELGIALLDRSQLGGRRPVRLTEAGRLLASHADRLSEVLAAAEADLAALTGQVAGPVSIGAFPTAIRHVVVPAAAELAAAAPGVQVRVRQLEATPGRMALLAGRLDLLITESKVSEPPLADRGIRATRLLDDPYRIAVPSGWPPVSGVEELLDRPWVDGPPGSAMRRVLDYVDSRYGVAVARPHECLEFPPALSIVAAGLAAAVVPALAISGDAAGIRFVDDSVVGSRRLDVEFRRGRHEPSPAARAVLSAIRTAVARG
jgi:DNA-binding transcriptional LysR family regulator